MLFIFFSSHIPAELSSFKDGITARYKGLIPKNTLVFACLYIAQSLPIQFSQWYQIKKNLSK